MLEEIRIGSLGVIDSSTLELGPGSHRDHRRDRCRQDDDRHRARPAARWPRRHRRRPHRRRGPPGSRAWSARRPRRVRRRGRGGRGRGRGRPGRAGPQRLRRGPLAGVRRRRLGPRRPCSPSSPSRWSRCTASPTSTGCSSRAPSARRWTGSAATRWPRCWRATARSTTALRATERELDEVVATRPRAGPRGRPAPVRARARSRRSSPSRARTPRWRPRRPGSATPTRCAPPPSRPARRSPASDGAARRPGRDVGRPRPLWTASATTTPRPASSPTGWPRSPTCSPTSRPTSRRTPPRLETDPARLAAVSERRAALTALTRKYGETIDEVLAWAEQSAARLLDLDDTDERIEAAARRAGAAARRARRRRRARCPRPGPRRPAGWPTRSPPSSPCWRCRTPGSR